MAKVKEILTGISKPPHDRQYLIWCEGCGYEHAISPYVHRFNGDFERPTFSPSLLNNHNPAKVCHSFIVDGKIQYLGDCFHQLAGQTVELMDVEGRIK